MTVIKLLFIIRLRHLTLGVQLKFISDFKMAYIIILDLAGNGWNVGCVRQHIYVILIPDMVLNCKRGDLNDNSQT